MSTNEDLAVWQKELLTVEASRTESLSDAHIVGEKCKIHNAIERIFKLDNAMMGRTIARAKALDVLSSSEDH